MTFGEKCRSQGYYGKKWGKMFFWGKMSQGKMSWGKTSLGKIVLHPFLDLKINPNMPKLPKIKI